MATEKIHFENELQQRLSGKLELPTNGKAKAFAIFAHCFTCNKNFSAILHISRALTQHGIAVLSFDFTGLGQSEGDFADTNFSSNMDDLESAYQYLKANHMAPELIIGHSLGGAAVLQASNRMESVKAVVTIGAPADPPHVQRLFKESLDKINTQGTATVSIGGRPFTIKKQFIDDLDANSIVDQQPKYGKALLVMHSPIDSIVSVDNARKIYEFAKHPKSFVSLDGADHLLSQKEDSRYAGNMIATWVERYISEEKEEQAPESPHQVTTGTEESYTTQVVAGHHRLVVDEPTDLGGADLGPTPYDMLLGSLGSCTGITLRMYADHKKWDLKKVKVHLQHDKIHARDCEGCKTGEGKIDHIERFLELEGNLDETQRQRLLEIADKCPVHRTLHGEIKVNTSLK